jgi:hypothetical protein
MMEHRHSWRVNLGGGVHDVDIVYRALSGWMSIEVDGVRVARGWREFQTVFGGAELSCELDGHRLHARVTQPWGRQEYAMALAVDGVLQPGSDAQPDRKALNSETLKAIALLTLVIGVAVIFMQLVTLSL